jgi:hypothetical protein
MLDLQPGKYKCTLKLPGKPDQTGEVVVAANDTWGLLIGPGGILPMLMS